METILVIFSHDVEEEGVRVVVEGFMIQEHLGNKAEMLCISLKEGGRGVTEENQLMHIHTKMQRYLLSCCIYPLMYT